MRLLTKTSAALLVVGGVVVTISYAAPDDTLSPTNTTKVGPASLGKMSVTEMSLRAVTIETQIKEDSRHVLHLQSQAHKQKDVIKLNCINDKLVQLKAQNNIFDGINSTLQAALATNSEERFSLYAEAGTAGANIKHLREEADVCAGEPELFKQESRNEVTKPLIPDDPAGTYGMSPGVEPPAYASPFR
jgi:hypothetical protein